MKKSLLMIMACVLMASCSNDKMETGIEEGNIIFEVSAVSKLKDGINTKGNLYSQETNLHVTNVMVHAFMNTGSDYVYQKSYNIGWSDGLSFKRYTIASSDKLPAGDYKFLAIGRNASDMFTVTDPAVANTYSNMMASVANTGNETEIFAGSLQATVDAQGSRIVIEMERQVAGIMGYFKNVPQYINNTLVKYLRLSVTDVNQAVNLTTGLGISTAMTPYNLIDMDLSTQMVNADEIYMGNDLSSQGVVKVDNSQLSGMYLIPVSNIQMTLGLYDANENPLKTWTVNDIGGLNTFNILANNFYSLGVKKQTGNTTGGTSDPSDDDDPIDLLADQAIIIEINPAWDLVHNLTLANN